MTSHLRHNGRWGREYKWNVSSGSQLSLKCFKVSDTQENPEAWVTEGWEVPHGQKTFLFHSVFLHHYTFIDLLWIWRDTFLLILLNQPVSKSIIEVVAYVYKIHNWADWQKEVKGSFALGLRELLQLNLDCFFTVFSRSTELTSVKLWKHWEGWTGDINFSFRVSG